MNLGPWLLLVPVILLAAPSAAAVGGHYVPQSGDRFDYYETYQLGSGSGNYSNYYENTFINGTIGVTGTLPNGTESASYSNSDSWSNVSGTAYQWTSSGDFSFSAATFAYVQGTDNQTGYTNPLVWFYVNNSLPEGAGLTLLNTNSHVVSTDYSYALGSPYNENVATIFVEGPVRSTETTSTGSSRRATIGKRTSTPPQGTSSGTSMWSRTPTRPGTDS